jgi:hypothetical protein
MVDNRVWRHLLGIAGALLLAAALPACSSPNGPQPPWVRSSSPDSSNIVYRPAFPFPFPQPRALYPGGYAGASYGPRAQQSSVVTPPPGTATEGQPSVSISQGTWETESSTRL